LFAPDDEQAHRFVHEQGPGSITFLCPSGHAELDVGVTLPVGLDTTREVTERPGCLAERPVLDDLEM
jgi:hypothetical protein